MKYDEDVINDLIKNSSSSEEITRNLIKVFTESQTIFLNILFREVTNFENEFKKLNYESDYKSKLLTKNLMKNNLCSFMVNAMFKYGIKLDDIKNAINQYEKINKQKNK